MSEWKEMTLEATIENVTPLTEFVDEQLEAIGCPVKTQMQIDIAIDELFSNIANYAYNPEIGKATVQVEVNEDERVVSISFLDRGKPYDPLQKEDPDVTLDVEEREIGGLGIYMVKKSMDDVIYEYKDGQNVLTIRKKF